MTDYQAPAPPKPRRSRWAAILFLLYLVIAAALAYGGWQLWQARAQTEDALAAQDNLLRRLNRQLGDASAEIQQLSEHQNDLSGSSKRNADNLATLQARTADVEASVARIDATLQGGRGRAQLFAVEQLLLIANERAQLAHDSSGALEALTLAQERLNALAEPKLFEIREALAHEITAVQALPKVDLGAAALMLSGLIEQAPSWPQRSRAPHHLNTADSEPDRDLSPAASNWLARGWANLRKVLGAVFVVRRTDKPVDKLLPVEQEGLVGQLLLLKLETARAALLSGNSEALQGAAHDAQNFLAEYYRPDDPAVLAARAALDRLQTLDLAPKLPDLSRSVGLLRAYLDANPR